MLMLPSELSSLTHPPQHCQHDRTHTTALQLCLRTLHYSLLKPQILNTAALTPRG